MSAKLTVVVYILICFEIGLLLLILPWKPQYWDENIFLYFITGKLNAPWLATALTSGVARGAVSGLGALNILVGLRDIFKFRESIDLLQSVGKSTPDNSTHDSPGSAAPAALPDHQSPGLPPTSH